MKMLDIQQAIFDKLTAELSVPVFDHVPQETHYPYAVVGDDTSTPFDTDDSTGTEATVTIHTWSQYRGRKEAKELNQAIYNALHRETLEINGAHFVECFSEFEQTLVESDGLTRHGINRFRIIIEF